MSWTSKPKIERLKHIGGFIAMTKSLEAAVKSVRGHYDAWGTTPEGKLLFLTGETRVGKTTALDEFITDVHSEIHKEFGKKSGYEVFELAELNATMAITYKAPDGFRRPVLKILVDRNPSFEALLADVYFLLAGKRFTASSKPAERMFLLKVQLREQKVRLIIFDDAQHICESTRNRKYDAADLLKVILKETRVQIICAGLPHTTEILDANSQADDMTTERHPVEPFALDVSPRSQLMKFMRTINDELPFDSASELDDPDVALRTALFAHGRVGRIMLFVHSTTDFAIDHGYQAINARAFAETLRNKFQVPDEDNVFLMNEGDLRGYGQLMHTRRQERLRAAENRRSRRAGHKRRRKAFGARGQ